MNDASSTRSLSELFDKYRDSDGMRGECDSRFIFIIQDSYEITVSLPCYYRVGWTVSSQTESLSAPSG
jgi:hypothetical protein